MVRLLALLFLVAGPPAGQGVPKPKPPRKSAARPAAAVAVVAHYIGFRSFPGGAITPELIRDPDIGAEKLKLSALDVDMLYRLIDRKDRDGRFKPERTRLLIEKSPGRPQVLVDQVGGVRRGDGAEYVLSPLEFLFLSDSLEYIANRQTPGRPENRAGSAARVRTRAAPKASRR